MSNQDQSPFEPVEPEKKPEENGSGPSYPPSEGSAPPPPPGSAPSGPAPIELPGSEAPAAPPPPSTPSVELERHERVPSPDGAVPMPVETFEREGVLPSFSDRRPAPAPPPSPVEPVSPVPAAPSAAPSAPPPPPAPPLAGAPSSPPPPPAAPTPPAQQQAAEPAPSSPDAEALECARKQLESLKARNRLLKYILIALTAIVLMIAGAIAFLYNKIAAFFPSGEMYQSGAMQSFSSDPASQLRALPGARPFGGQGGQQGGSSLFLIKGAGGGGNGAGPGEAQLPVPQVPQLSKEEAAAMKSAMAKYSERPLVKEFIEDLKQDPVVGEAFRSGKQPTPADFVMVLNNPASVQRITMKYATRPEFMALMMEFINDPAFRPMLGNMQGMGLPQPPRETSALPPPGAEGEVDTNAVSAPPSKRRMTTRKVPPPGAGD